MGESKLPLEVLRVIETGGVSWSSHASESADRLSLWYADVLELARSAESYLVQQDELQQALDGLKHVFVGLDSRRRRMYLAGKVMYVGGAKRFHVLTLHEPDW